MRIKTLVAAALLALSANTMAATFGDYQSFGGVAEAGIGVLGGDAGSSPFVGEASVEMEALDSSSNRQVAAFIETRAAKKYNVDLSAGVGNAVSKGVGGFADSFNTWAYTKKAMTYWATRIGDWLDSARSAGNH
jgi:hypothetical protein